jgi:hypothetical protein
MSFRFWRRVRLAPGVTLNLSKSTASLSFGPRGAKYTVSPRGWTLRHWRRPCRPVLASLPFAFAVELDPVAVDQQVQRAVRTAIRDLDGQGLLPEAQRGKVRHGPV